MTNPLHEIYQIHLKVGHSKQEILFHFQAMEKSYKEDNLPQDEIVEIQKAIAEIKLEIQKTY